MPFWSSEARAKRVVETVNAYKNFEPVPIELTTFAEKWLPGMQKDGLLCGLNWSGERVTGYDLAPSDVLAKFMAYRP